ncbi:c-type cytochrome [Gimesia aquarii]|uniref:Di-heme cytochrome c peroxidase n=1 Tax=Gimesia aquarii TaxID=2527964 RepID=A0A517WXD6_9PLAN|nr:c-type cytochrome [Gimesia aquarii]QDU09927.1 Di-heme cytochrome c peroxidase [Gimesia aquarii]
MSHRRRSVRFFYPLTLACFISLLLSPQFVSAGKSNSLMDISTDGKLLACSNRDSGSVTIIDLDTNKKLTETKVGKHPEGVTFLGNTHTLATAVYDDDLVVFLDGDTGKKIGQTEVFDEPYGVVSTSDGTKVFVTLDYPGRIVEIDTNSKNVIREFSNGKHLRGIAISSDDQNLFTTEYYTALVRNIDVKSGRTIDEWPGGSTDNLARQITLHPRRPKAYLPHIRSRVTVAHGAGSIFPIVSIVDTKSGEGKRRRKIPMDSFRGARVTSNPWDTAITPDGKTFFVIFAGTDDMYICNVIDDDYRELTFRASLNLGHNPRAVRVAPDGNTVYVYNALDFEVVAYGTQFPRPRARIKVSENPLGEEILLGKRLFYTALQPMSSRLWISCASCHPDGQPDGKTWHNPEGLRNTQSLAGMAWTHPIHWSADRDEVQDFEHTIRGPLMQGKGLAQGKINPSLEAPNKGLSRALDAMAAYSNTHEFTLSPYAKKGLTPAAKRGRRLFFSKQTQCATCHSGPFLTDSVPTGRIVRHDVGTSVDNPGEKMGPAYDTPTLLGLYRTAPYLHHGKAQSLEEVLTIYNHDDKHGKTSQLSKQQIADLVEFLKALPYEDPVPKAKAAGLVKISK